MSMNLNAKEVDLLQTPTWITYMCYSNRNGGWKGILYRYEQWVWSTMSGVWQDSEDLDYKIESIKRHLKIVHDAVKKHKKLTFSII
jgi:hypothetical protein